MRKSQKILFDLPVSDLSAILGEAEADLHVLRGSRIFLTGGTGFFGKWFVGALAHADAELELGLQLTILSRNPAPFWAIYPEAKTNPALRFEMGDAAHFSSGERYDFVLHAATDTLSIQTAAQEEERSRAIVEGTRRMLELTRQSGARRLLNISSGGIYGAAAGRLSGAQEEDDQTATPVTSYSRSKREAELLCADSGLDWVNARPFAFLGPHLPLDAHYAAGNFLRDAQRGGPILVRGDGTALRSYLYPTDLVTWLLGILARGQNGRSYNVGSDEVVSTGDLARRIAAACQPAPEVVIQSSLPHGPQNIYLPDVTRARTELALEVRVPLEEAIRRTLAFLQRRSGD